MFLGVFITPWINLVKSILLSPSYRWKKRDLDYIIKGLKWIGLSKSATPKGNMGWKYWNGRLLVHQPQRVDRVKWEESKGINWRWGRGAFPTLKETEERKRERERDKEANHKTDA